MPRAIDPDLPAISTAVESPSSAVRAIATGTPPIRKPQSEALAFMEQVDGLSDALKKRLPELYERTGISYRHTGLEDYDRTAEEFEFFPPDWSLEPAPSTAERMEKYREIVTPLTTRISEDALQSADLEPESITHLITTTCTGFSAPGFDVALVDRLGLSPGIARDMIGFMGCQAAFNGLRSANAICRSDPGARVLLVCAELCTLHFQVESSLESAIVNALFSDGAAAAVLSRNEKTADGPSSSRPGAWQYLSGRNRLVPDTREAMSWEIGNRGFEMGLSPRVADQIGSEITEFTEGLLSDAGLAFEEIDFWAVHPGGPRVLDRVEEELGLASDRLSESRAVLERFGNMSSPTILFILQRCFERTNAESGVALGFGPGLTIQGAVFRRART